MVVRAKIWTVNHNWNISLLKGWFILHAKRKCDVIFKVINKRQMISGVERCSTLWIISANRGIWRHISLHIHVFVKYKPALYTRGWSLMNCIINHVILLKATLTHYCNLQQIIHYSMKLTWYKVDDGVINISWNISVCGAFVLSC